MKFSLKKSLAEAAKKKVAIGHFNVSELVTLKAVVHAALELSSQAGRQIPIMIGVSEGEREAIGTKTTVALVHELQKEYDHPIFINADHTHSFEKVKEAVSAGFDEILFDGGKLSLNENILATKEVVNYVKLRNSAILVEGEMGYIGSGSEVLKEIPTGAAITLDTITKPDDAARFVKETKVDLFAPAVGNIHGILASGTNPHLFIDRIKELKAAAPIPFVLHGGSGTPDEDFIKAIDAGINVIHISTELRRAWRQGIESGLKSQPDEVAPYKLLAPSLELVKEVVTARLKLFNRL